MRFLREEIYLFFSRTDLCLKYRFIIPWNYPYIQVSHKINLDQSRVHLDPLKILGLNELATGLQMTGRTYFESKWTRNWSKFILWTTHRDFPFSPHALFYIRANVCSKSWLFMSLSDYESYFMNHHKLSNKKSEYSIIRASFQGQFMVSYLLDNRLAIDEKIPDWWLTRVWEPKTKS